MRRYYYFKSIHFQRLLSQGCIEVERASEHFIMDAGEASTPRLSPPQRQSRRQRKPRIWEIPTSSRYRTSILHLHNMRGRKVKEGRTPLWSARARPGPGMERKRERRGSDGARERPRSLARSLSLSLCMPPPLRSGTASAQPQWRPPPPPPPSGDPAEQQQLLLLLRKRERERERDPLFLFWPLSLSPQLDDPICVGLFRMRKCVCATLKRDDS